MQRRRRSIVTTHVPLAKHTQAGAVGLRHQRVPQHDGGTRTAYGLIAAVAFAGMARACVLVALLASGSAFASQPPLVDQLGRLLINVCQVVPQARSRLVILSLTSCSERKTLNPGRDSLCAERLM